MNSSQLQCFRGGGGETGGFFHFFRKRCIFVVLLILVVLVVVLFLCHTTHRHESNQCFHHTTGQKFVGGNRIGVDQKSLQCTQRGFDIVFGCVGSFSFLRGGGAGGVGGGAVAGAVAGAAAAAAAAAGGGGVGAAAEYDDDLTMTMMPMLLLDLFVNDASCPDVGGGPATSGRGRDPSYRSPHFAHCERQRYAPAVGT